MPHIKKYQLITNLKDLGIQGIVDELKQDRFGERKLCHRHYAITTNGGDSCFWQVNHKDGTYYTVSTKPIGFIKIRARNVNVPEYEHYVLTEEGIQYIKNLVVMHSL